MSKYKFFSEQYQKNKHNMHSQYLQIKSEVIVSISLEMIISDKLNCVNR